MDEADEMLNQGLREQLEQIFKRLPVASISGDVDPICGVVRSRVQRIVVSATWTSGCRDVMQQFLDNPVCILVPRYYLHIYLTIIFFPKSQPGSHQRATFVGMN